HGCAHPCRHRDRGGAPDLEAARPRHQPGRDRLRHRPRRRPRPARGPDLDLGRPELSKYYVLLTGAKNNAGDFLIRERAIALLRRLRPDRELVNLDGWRPITDEQLELVNGAEALRLTGGPWGRPNMRPDIYVLRPRLSDVRVPITTLGVGWRGPTGDWALTRHAAFSPASRELLERIREDGLRSSVRDYHTLNVLRRAGIGRVV